MKRHHGVLLNFLLIAGFMLIPSLSPAADISSRLEGEDCEARCSIKHKGTDLTAVQCGNVLIFSDYTMLPVPTGTVLLCIDNAFHWYTPSINKRHPVDLSRRQFGGWE